MSFRRIRSVYLFWSRKPPFMYSQKLRLSSKFSMHVISRVDLRGILIKVVTYTGSTVRVKPVRATANKSPLEIRRGVHWWHG